MADIIRPRLRHHPHRTPDLAGQAVGQAWSSWSTDAASGSWKGVPMEIFRFDRYEKIIRKALMASTLSQPLVAMM